MLKIDMHVHTRYSPDSLLSEKAIVSACIKRGLTGVAITDHNTIKGALKLKELAPPDFKVITGEEIDTREGEIIGYFLEKEIPPQLSPEETIKRIKVQGGLVGIPHPFDSFRKSRISKDALERLITPALVQKGEVNPAPAHSGWVKRVDIIEVFNSRNIYAKDNQKALNLARENGFAMVVGSDAHLNSEVGRAYVELNSFNTPQEFLRNLHSARLITNRSSLWVHVVTICAKLFHILLLSESQNTCGKIDKKK
jgi:predicted metal-dependent phosphoesterase TrpH